MLHGVSKQESLPPCRSPCEAAKTWRPNDKNSQYIMGCLTSHRTAIYTNRWKIAGSLRKTLVSVHSLLLSTVFFLCLFSTSFHPWKASFGQVWKKGVGGFYPRDSYPVWIGAVSYGSRSWRTWESYIGLAGCGMTVKMGAGCGMTEISMARYRTKIILQERDLLKLTAGMRDSFKIVVRIRDETKENHGGL